MTYVQFDSNMKFDEIQIIDDGINDVDFIRKIIKSKDQEEAFYVLDVGDIIKKHRNLRSKMPRVEPHFAIKCNPDPTVIKTLIALNGSFDCASKREIQQVLSNGGSSDRIIFANTIKPPSHIKFAKKVGVNLLTVDNELELEKIKSIFPEARIVIRFRCDAAVTEATFGLKCGCDPDSDAPKLIRKAKDLGLNVHGFSFHVGTNSSEILAWSRGIKIAMGLINYAESLGLEDVKLIDIGGGFPSANDHPIDKFARTINEALGEIDPSIRVISEPGRYYVATAFTLAANIFGKRTINEGESTRYMYYVNDGTYGSFHEVMMKIRSRIPRPLNKPRSEETHPSTFWGPTCASYDCVVRDCDFPELNISDWLLWKGMGAYTVALAGNYNGIPPSAVFPFISRNNWNSFLQERTSNGNMMINGSKEDWRNAMVS